MKSSTLRAPFLGLSLLLCSCTGVAGDPTPVTEGENPTTSASVFPPVTFDPCDDIDDSIVRQLGLDPDSRSHEEEFTEVERLSCSFMGDYQSITIISQNDPWEELPGILSGPQHTTTVNGRESIYAISPIGERSCAVLMRTHFGAVIVSALLISTPDPDLKLTACDGIMHIAETIEPLITNA